MRTSRFTVDWADANGYVPLFRLSRHGRLAELFVRCPFTRHVVTLRYVPAHG